MNRPNLKRLRDHLASLPPERFDMGYWTIDQAHRERIVGATELQHNCGTAGCIGGWAQALFGADPEHNHEVLGLDDDQIGQLFFPASYLGVSYDKVTLPIAVRVLDELIETGNVNWPDEVKR